ncbi:MAG: TAXI family TRAP transporter solute-binding subunit [Deltaproteobacteria bacterium]|nr:TAXI family TRAP transporter solute-binding subunit [Deltaproteobacteria bacterium]
MDRRKFVGFICILVLALFLGGTATWAAEWPKTISIATASVGGTFYYVGGAFVKIFEKMDVKATVEVTGGSVHNPKLLQAKQLLFAIIAQGSAWQAYTGTGWAKQKHDNLRSLVAVFPSYGHGYTLAKKNIKTFRDFHGKIVSGGPPGGTSDMYLRDIGALLGVKFTRVVTVPFADTVNLLRDGMIDAGWSSGGVPLGAANEVTSTLDGVIIGFAPDDLKKIEAKYPFLSPSEVPPNVYKNQPYPVPATADWSALFAHKDVPDDMVYKFLETTFASYDLLVATHKALKDVTLENQKYLALPLHPGAYKFYKEKGVAVPDKALPPK